MKKNEKLIKKIKANKSAIIKIFIITILFFGTNIYFTFATDTYRTFETGFELSALNMTTRNGRPVIGFIYWLFSLSGLPNEFFYYISTALALLFLMISIWLYQKILKKYGMKENIRIILAFALIANPFIIEYFMFIEKCGFMFAILFNVIAVYFIEKFFEQKGWKNMAVAIAMMVLAMFTYQGTIALFVILSLPFALKYAKGFKDYVLNILSIGIPYAISMLTGMVAFKFLFKSTRVSEDIDLIANLKNMIYGLREYTVTTFNILPEHLFLVLFSVAFFIAIIAALIQRERKIICVLSVFLIVFAAIVFSTATILQGSGWWAMRTVYPIASVVGVLVIQVLINSDRPEKKNKEKIKYAQVFAVLAVGILLVGQYLSFNKVFINKYELNALDEYRYEYVGQTIREYQETTGVKITKIAFYSDVIRTYPPYPYLYTQGDLITSAFYTDWSDLSAMNYYLGTDYEKVDPTAKYTKYFSSKDWDRLSQEQLIFDGDTLHLCVY